MADERAVKLRDGDREVDASFFVEVWEGRITAVLEHRGGRIGDPTARNTEYAEGLELLLARLGLRGATLVDLRVDSDRTEGLTPEECRVHVRNRDLPVPLGEVAPKPLRLDITASIADAGRPLALRTFHHNSGAWKRIRLYLDVPGFDPDPEHAAILQRQLRGGGPAERPKRRPGDGPLSPFEAEPVNPALTEQAYLEALRIPEGATDLVGRAKRRTEQRYLRQLLLRGRDAAACDLCGRVYPPGFLVAAHIKRRADCSEAERKDARHVVMLACRFGCDALYEAGVIYVDDGGVVREGRAAERLEGQEEELQRCANRPCGAWREGSAGYFRWHREVVAGV
ncbi:MAG: hypothetical protein H6741_30830 [Alphaproteobacteria bacterium]|nr:hypothetical protein [Alphaproteobacteria bacterium]